MSQPLELRSVIGFAGGVPNGLIAHPDGETVMYPLGSTVVLRNKTDSSKQEFLRGHSEEVSRPYSTMILQNCFLGKSVASLQMLMMCTESASAAA
jgi:hypothetical protein